MELFVAAWTLRAAIVAALAVGAASYAAGTAPITSADRALAAAVLFTFAGRWLVGWLEPPERRLLRMRKKREARRAKANKAAKGAKPEESARAAARAASKAADAAESNGAKTKASTVSRSA
jgi:hypothetical protein